MTALDLDRILGAAELAVQADDDAMLGRAIEALGLEVARRDPATARMFELDAELRRLAAEKVSAVERDLVRVEAHRR